MKQNTSMFWAIFWYSWQVLKWHDGLTALFKWIKFLINFLSCSSSDWLGFVLTYWSFLCELWLEIKCTTTFTTRVPKGPKHKQQKQPCCEALEKKPAQKQQLSVFQQISWRIKQSVPCFQKAQWIFLMLDLCCVCRSILQFEMSFRPCHARMLRA